ncbi:ATP synthase subunit I [Gilvimarinus xylanilyticus]|uniref:ATP synthase subunit I n=1 Tax=Gilvimarinus xylanilyticus TaxID=2944139 RepID=A0A9X2I6R8_9GAMM|nr:ATP synthase subunit I [Gilvimarinus xylanilyticus]MCP8900487.1 ATP synthase subunit I [Gilvimarinus xylanilyticus]
MLRLWIILLVIAAPVVFWRPVWGISLLWGFSVCLVPSMVFARFAGQIRGASAVRQSVNRFYRAESAKLLLTAALFAAVFTRDVPISLPVFLCAFVVAQIAQMIVTAKATGRSLRQQ